MKKTVRWGLMGAGAILDRWMKGVANVADMEIVAIASRTKESAVRQAEKYNIPNICTYEELVNRDDIDIVYVNTIHTAHKQMAMMAMKAGKAVLCEKPAAVNAQDYLEMAECAKENNVFFMEAVWTRFFPAFNLIKDAIKEGKIGDVRVVQSVFSFSVPEEKKDARLFDPNQAGGALLDVGVYSLHFANIILNEHPISITGLASINSDDNKFGVDETCGVVALYNGGTIAMMTSGIRGDMSETAYVYGSKGYIEIPHFYKPYEARIVCGDKTEMLSSPVPQCVPGIDDEGYQFEIAYVNDCIRNGIKESDVVPCELSYKILSQCDELRQKWGLRYPFE